MTEDQPTAVITGGEGTLAQAMAAEFRAAGWRVHAPSRADMDVREGASVAAWFAGQERLDLLINNAGLRRDAAFAKLTENDWNEVVSVNLSGVARCCRAAHRLMQARGRGHIVNLSSHTARHGVAGQAAYGAAKAGLLALTQSLAAEWGPENIRVNAVLPGWMPTRFNATVPAAVHEEVRRGHHLGRFNTPEQTARFVLALHALEHTSGQIFQLDSRPGSWL